MSTIVNKVYKGEKFSITPAPPDHRIYSRGFVIGGKVLKKSSKNTPETNSKPKRKKEYKGEDSPMSDKKTPLPKEISEEFQADLEEWMNHGIYEAAQNQWSMTSISIPKEKSPSSTGQEPNE